MKDCRWSSSHSLSCGRCILPFGINSEQFQNFSEIALPSLGVKALLLISRGVAALEHLATIACCTRGKRKFTAEKSAATTFEDMLPPCSADRRRASEPFHGKTCRLAGASPLSASTCSNIAAAWSFHPGEEPDLFAKAEEKERRRGEETA